MKRIISFLMLLTFVSNVALADCDFSTGITPGPNKTFVYSEECHLKVGQLVQQNTTLLAQVGDLTKAIDLKDLALTKADQRTQLWMDTNDKLQDRLSKIDEVYRHNELLYYGLGVLTVFVAAYAVHQIR